MMPKKVNIPEVLVYQCFPYLLVARGNSKRSNLHIGHNFQEVSSPIPVEVLLEPVH